MSFTAITVTGTYNNESGGVASGYVQFQLFEPMYQSGGASVMPVLAQANLNGSGAISISLNATDDSGTITGSGGAACYKVTEQIFGAPANVYYITVPHSAGGGTIPITQCTRVVPG